MKKALITGITGQDGSYLAELLLEKGYEVHGIVRRASTFNTWRINHLYEDPHNNPKLRLHYGDLTDSTNLIRVIKEVKPDEIYNLGAQSHVHVSFDAPEFTANSDALGTLRILEAIRILDMADTVKLYQASTSELFGDTPHVPQNEETPFKPRSPYAVAKLYAYEIIRNYREAYGIFACNGILFNHESPRRGQTFVTRKITMALCNIAAKKQDKLYLGNLDSKRDWGHAKEYVEMMWQILQHDKPEDFVMGTGKSHSVREFVEESCRLLGINLKWQGQGVDEIGIDASTGNTIIEIDPKFFRKTEVPHLLADISKAKRILGWEPKITFKELVKDMIEHDKNLVNNNGVIY